MQNFNAEQAKAKNTDKKLIISDVRQSLINYIDSRINYFSGGDEMKSLNESIRDEIFVKELEKMKKIINNSVCRHEWIMTADSFDQTCYCKKCGTSS